MVYLQQTSTFLHEGQYIKCYLLHSFYGGGAAEPYQACGIRAEWGNSWRTNERKSIIHSSSLALQIIDLIDMCPSGTTMRYIRLYKDVIYVYCLLLSTLRCVCEYCQRVTITTTPIHTQWFYYYNMNSTGKCQIINRWYLIYHRLIYYNKH